MVKEKNYFNNFNNNNNDYYYVQYIITFNNLISYKRFGYKEIKAVHQVYLPSRSLTQIACIYLLRKRDSSFAPPTATRALESCSLSLPLARSRSQIHEDAILLLFSLQIEVLFPSKGTINLTTGWVDLTTLLENSRVLLSQLAFL